MTPYELSALIVSFVLICSAVDVTNYFHQVRYGNCRAVSKLLLIIHLGFFFFFFNFENTFENKFKSGCLRNFTKYS